MKYVSPPVPATWFPPYSKLLLPSCQYPLLKTCSVGVLPIVVNGIPAFQCSGQTLCTILAASLSLTHIQTIRKSGQQILSQLCSVLPTPWQPLCSRPKSCFPWIISVAPNQSLSFCIALLLFILHARGHTGSLNPFAVHSLLRTSHLPSGKIKVLRLAWRLCAI